MEVAERLATYAARCAATTFRSTAAKAISSPVAGLRVGSARSPRRHGGAAPRPASRGQRTTPEMREPSASEPKTLIVTKANVQVTRASPHHTDYVGVKRFDAPAWLVGERRIIGLFTSPLPIRDRRATFRTCAARSTSSRDHAGFDRQRSHSGKALAMCSRPTRATICSRSIETRSTVSRSPSCRSRSVRACGCCAP